MSAPACWLVRFHGQGSDEARLCASAGCRWWSTSSLRRGVGCGEIVPALPFPMFVKPANLGSSVGISQGSESGGAAAALETGRRVTIARSSSSAASSGASSSARCWATHDPRCGDAVRNPAVARVLRLRRQVPAGSSADRCCRRDLTPEQTERDAAAGGGMLPGGGVRRYGARRFPDGKRDGQIFTSTRSTQFRASRPSACTRRCGSMRASLLRTARPADRVGAGTRRDPRKRTRYSR